MFRFANIGYLWLLVSIPLLIGLAFYHRWRRARRLNLLAQGAVARHRLLPYESRWRFWFKNSCLYLSLALFIVALARPQFGIKEEVVKRTGSEVMLLLDVSRSMLAEDIKPNRLERAKLEIQQLVSKMQQDRVGLILFAGDAFVQLPITNDYLAAQMFIEEVSVGMISNQGTALGRALELAEKSFSPMKNVGRAIVVISDGENHEDDPISVAERLGQQGISIYTVGIGSAKGSPIPEESTGNYKQDASGNIVITRLDEATLQKVALASNGYYTNLGSALGGLDRIITNLKNLKKAEFEQQVYASYDEQYMVFLTLGLVFLLLSVMLYPRRHPWFNVDSLYGGLRRRMHS